MLTKILPGHTFRQHHAARRVEGGSSVALYHRKAEQFQKSRVGGQGVVVFVEGNGFFTGHRLALHDDATQTERPGGHFDFGKILRQARPDGRRRVGRHRFLIARFKVEGYGANAVGAGQESVEAAFVLHVQSDEPASRQTDGQARDVDERKERLPPEVAEGGFEVI